ncbi:MAG: PAS domain S-box protein, partial [Nitrospirae bacterium]
MSDQDPQTLTPPSHPADHHLHQVLHSLGERVKELTALHNTARILQADPPSTTDLLSQLVALLPPAWQYPEITAGRIQLHDAEVRSPTYRATPWTQQARFTYGPGHEGLIEVVYLEERPQEVEGPFLAEERNLINSLAEMLHLHLERKFAEASLRQLSKVFMDATDPILIEDLSGRIQDLNAEVERAYGWSRAELLGQPITMLIPEEDHQEAEALRSRCKQGELVRNIESRRRSKSGRIWPVLVTLSPLTDENGHMTGIATLTKDISALKIAERQLQQAYAELERRVEERTASLQQANAQLEEEIHQRVRVETKLEEMIQEIQHSHETLTAILNQLDLGTAMLDSDGRISFLNNAAARLLGTRVESCLGRAWVNVLGFEQEEDRITLEHSIRQPADRRNKQLARLRSTVGQCASWVEIDVRDDPRNPEGRILFLYDMTEVQDLRARLSDTLSVRDIVGKSAPMQLVFQLIHELARVDSTVLIEGETGTGKELVARAIHYASHRQEGPFIAVNCAGLTEALVASQLFGHRRGAFTGAVSDQQGLFEAAEGGTLFLDEIGDIPLAVQTSLLRVLQEREVTRLGETKTRKVNVRVIAATHHNLAKDVEQG